MNDRTAALQQLSYQPLADESGRASDEIFHRQSPRVSAIVSLRTSVVLRGAKCRAAILAARCTDVDWSSNRAGALRAARAGVCAARCLLEAALYSPDCPRPQLRPRLTASCSASNCTC